MKMTQNEKVLRGAEYFLKNPTYKPYMESLDDSLLAKVRSITPMDYVVLGKQFRQFENYKRLVTENFGTLKDLGQLPKFAYDVITANYAASIIPMLASVQPIKSQQGIVYFKQIKARTTRGNVTDGDILRNAIAKPQKQAVGFAGEKVIATLGTLANGQQSYAFNLTPAPVRERSVKIYISTSTTMWLIDDGEGNISPVGGALATGTINYSNGLINIDFIPTLAGGEVLSVEFGTEYEENGNLPTIQSGFDSADIKAEVFALRSEMGSLKAFELKQTFGKDAEAEMINDLTMEINAELGNTLISRIANASFGTPITWDSAHPAGVGEVEHKLAFGNRIAEASSRIASNAGRGEVTAMVCGVKAAALFDQQRGSFERTGFASSGPTLYGMYNKNIPVIRAVDVIGDSDVYCIYKGSGNFDAPAVYCPYMPLVVNGSLPVLNNVLKTQGYALVWAGMKTVVNRFITKIEVQNLV